MIDLSSDIKALISMYDLCDITIALRLRTVEHRMNSNYPHCCIKIEFGVVIEGS